MFKVEVYSPEGDYVTVGWYGTLPAARWWANYRFDRQGAGYRISDKNGMTVESSILIEY